MKEFKTRHRIKVGARVKLLGEIKTGLDKNGVPYWKFPVGLTEEKGGELAVYDWVWLKGSGKCEFANGQWLQITAIRGYSASVVANTAGGRNIYRTLECDFEKVVKED